MAKLIDLTGRRFGRLVVVERGANRKNGSARWVCKCDCGRITVVNAYHLKSGHTTSCGCFHNENAAFIMEKHLMCNTRIYQIWAGIKKRTTHTSCKDSKYYVKKGVDICEAWNEFEVFYQWAIENGYDDNLTIDRIDGSRGYSPENCRWVTQKVQCNNKSNNHFIEFQGEKRTVSQWAEKLGIKKCTLLSRIRKGWSVEKVITTPVKKK